MTEVVYHCHEGYTGGGKATCLNGEWDLEAKCVGKCVVLHIKMYCSYDKMKISKE